MKIKYLDERTKFGCYYAQAEDSRTGLPLFEQIGYHDTLEEVVKSECYLLRHDEFRREIQKDNVRILVYQLNEYTGKTVKVSATIIVAEGDD